MLHITQKHPVDPSRFVATRLAFFPWLVYSTSRYLWFLGHFCHRKVKALFESPYLRSAWCDWPLEPLEPMRRHCGLHLVASAVQSLDATHHVATHSDLWQCRPMPTYVFSCEVIHHIFDGDVHAWHTLTSLLQCAALCCSINRTWTWTEWFLP